MRTHHILFLVVVLCATSAATAMPSSYTVTDLGTLPGYTYSYAYGMNDLGQIVGRSQRSGGTNDLAFLWQNGEMADLGTFGFTHGSAHAINNASQVVGYSQHSADGDYQNHAVFWEAGTVTYLETLGGTHANARDINDSGQVVGTAQTDGGSYHPCLWQNGETVDLGTLGLAGNCSATAINESGEVVGYLNDGNVVSRAFSWTEGGGMVELARMPGDRAWALDINNTDLIVGQYSPQGYPGPSHAIMWNGAATVDLGTLGGTAGCAMAVNDLGQVVGYSKTASNDIHAFLWEDGVMYDLNDLIPSESDWVLQFGYDINEAGCITGYGVSPNGEIHGFVLVPEPATLSLLALGACLSLFHRKRR